MPGVGIGSAAADQGIVLPEASAASSLHAVGAARALAELRAERIDVTITPQRVLAGPYEESQ